MLEYIFADRQYLIRRPPTYNPEEKKEIIRLVNQAKGGAKEAMSRLIEQSEPLVYSNCLRLLNDPEEARDMAQEVYLTIFLKLDTLKKPEAFFDWVKVIKVNKCKNKLKQNNPYFLLEDANGPAQPLYEEKDQTDPYAFIEDKHDQISPDKTLDTKETQELLFDLINDLPDAQRMVLILFYYDDYSIRESARLMEISEGTVKSRLAYGRLALKKALEKEKKKGNILYGRTPVSLLAYIAYFLKKTFPDQSDEVILSSIRETVLAALSESSAASAGVAGGAGSALISAVDTAAVESANAFISGGLSLKGLSLTALWATAWGKAAITTIASAALIGSVAGGISLTARTKQPEPIPVETADILQEETLEESTESTPEQNLEEPAESIPEPNREASAETSQEEVIETSAFVQTEEASEPVIVETNESGNLPVETEQTTENSETIQVTEPASESTETEQTTIVKESSGTPEETSDTNSDEETIVQLEQELVQQQVNMEGVQANYDNALASYQDALSFAEENLSEAKLICERELNTWTESYANLLQGYEGQELDEEGKQDVALHEEQIARWQSNYNIVMSATIEDVKNQIFPADFENVNVAGANLAEKEQEFIFWEDLRKEQQARLDEAQAALDAAKQ